MRRPLLRSRLRLPGGAVNPFLAGDKGFFFEYPLPGLFDEAARLAKEGRSRG